MNTPVKKIKLPKIPNRLTVSINNDNDNYKYFKKIDSMIEQETIRQILKGSATGVII